MIMMEVLEKECEKHGLALLLHEKPFAGVNGSGKHTNWSLATDTGKRFCLNTIVITKTGENLLAPGNNPKHNAQFLFVLAAFLKAVRNNSDILRAYISVPGWQFYHTV